MSTHMNALIATWAAMLVLAGPASAEFKMNRQMALAPGGTFTLDTDIGAVTVAGDSTGGVGVSVTSGRDDFADQFDVRFDETPGEARVTVKRKTSISSLAFWRTWSGANTRFVVHVPRQTSLTVNTSGGAIDVSQVEGRARLHTSGGGVRVESVAGNVDAGTSGGAIQLREIRGDAVADTSGGGIEVAGVRGTLTAKTSGGGIRIRGVSGDVVAETSGGGVEIREAGGRVEAHSSGGPITVSFAPGNGRGGNISTSGGGIRAELDPKVAMSIDASASGGGVQSDLPVTVRGRISRDSLRGEMNGGGPLLRMSTSGGGVRISGVTRE